MRVFIVKPEDGLFLKADGTWSGVQEEAKVFPDALSARKFSKSHGLNHINVHRSGQKAFAGQQRTAHKSYVPRTIAQARGVFRVRIVSDGNDKNAPVVTLCWLPLPGQILEQENGENFQVTAIVAMGDAESDVTLYIRGFGPQALTSGDSQRLR